MFTFTRSIEDSDVHFREVFWMELAKVQEGYVPLILHQHTPIHRSNPLLTQGDSNEEAIV
jgi:hypothetical protein